MNTRKRYYNKSKPKTRKRQRGGKTMTKMNCSPLAEITGTVNKNSCFTREILEIIKKEYNKDHPNQLILSDNANEIWKELKNRLTNCDKEDCWLKQIDDSNLRKQIDETIFAPDSPPEWKHNPDEWLSNFDILDVLKQYEFAYPDFKFIGPTPIDFDTRPKEMNGKCVWEDLCHFSLQKILDEKKSKIGVVFNLDDHDEDGSHWVSLFVDLDNRFIIYFDSAGDKIPDEIKVLVDRILFQSNEVGIELEYIEKPKQHQYGNTECGMYALYFITTLLTGQTPDGTLLKTNKDKFEHFTGNRIPDKDVFGLRGGKFFNGGGPDPRRSNRLITRPNKFNPGDFRRIRKTSANNHKKIVHFKRSNIENGDDGDDGNDGNSGNLNPKTNNNSSFYTIKIDYDPNDPSFPLVDTNIIKNGNNSRFDKKVDYNIRRLMESANIEELNNKKEQHEVNLKREFTKNNKINKDYDYIKDPETTKRRDNDYQNAMNSFVSEKMEEYSKENVLPELNKIFPSIKKDLPIIPIFKNQTPIIQTNQPALGAVGGFRKTQKRKKNN